MTAERPGPAPDESFEELYEQAPFGYATTSKDDVVLRANATLLGWVGLSAEELVGRPFVELLSPGSRLFYESRHLPLLHLQGEAREVSLTIRRDDGDDLPVLVTARETDRGLVRVAVFDATSRERYERELLNAQRAAESAAGRVTVLQNASAAFGAAGSEGEMAAALATIVSDALVATESCVATLGADGEFEVIAGVNPLAGVITDRRPGLDALHTEEPVVVAVGDPRYPVVSAALLERRLNSLVAIPILRAGSPIGVVAAFFARERALADEELALVVAIAQQAGQALTRIRLQEELAHLALHDQLTGLANRLLLREHITQGLASAQRTGRPLSLMFVDLDGFKAVNDNLGHVTGDAVLRDVASRVRSVVRDNDVVGRYGGDEFVVICAETDAESAEVIADRIVDAIRAPFEAAPEYRITASVGIAVHRPGVAGAPSTDLLIDRADSAMYESKNAGRDRATVSAF